MRLRHGGGQHAAPLEAAEEAHHLGVGAQREVRVAQVDDEVEVDALDEGS